MMISSNEIMASSIKTAWMILDSKVQWSNGQHQRHHLRGFTRPGSVHGGVQGNAEQCPAARWQPRRLQRHLRRTRLQDQCGTPRHIKIITAENEHPVFFHVFPDIGLIASDYYFTTLHSNIFDSTRSERTGWFCVSKLRQNCPQHVSAKTCQANALQESTIYKPRTHIDRIYRT